MPCRIKLAFPYHDDFPAEGHKPCLDSGITPDIAVDLILPEPPVGLRQRKQPAAPVPVPEASVHKNHGMPFLQDNIRRARQRPDIQTVAESGGKEALAHDKLRTRVLATDVRHADMPLFPCHSVCHNSCLSPALYGLACFSYEYTNIVKHIHMPKRHRYFRIRIKCCNLAEKSGGSGNPDGQPADNTKFFYHVYGL